MYHQKLIQTENIDINVKKIFDKVIAECKRASTKMNLHQEKQKDELLAAQLEKVITIYGEAIASQFQSKYEKQNKGLSFLFAQVTNAVLERTFHEGRCHLQAAYSMFELYKSGIYNVSLVSSRINNPITEHWYLLILDDYTFKSMAQMPGIYVAVKPNGFNKMALFFDSWSEQICQWKNFQPQNKYTIEITKSTQAMFKPFIHVFHSEVEVFKSIIWCLTEYANYLKNIPSIKLLSLSNVENLSTPSDEKFSKEIEFLTNPEKCLVKMLSTIDSYKKEFVDILNLHSHDLNVITEQNIKEAETKLLASTLSFFKGPTDIVWKEYPKSNLERTKYEGHQVRFFTMKDEKLSSRADDFLQHLKTSGFNAEMKKAKNNPSIVVDLTTSKLTL